MQGHVENTHPLVPLTPQGPTRWGCEASRVRFGHRVRKAQLEEKPGSSWPAVASESPRLPPRQGLYTFHRQGTEGGTSSPSFDKADVPEGERSTAGFFQLLGWVKRPVTNHQQRTLGEGSCQEPPGKGQEAESLKLPCQAQGLASKWPEARPR